MCQCCARVLTVDRLVLFKLLSKAEDTKGWQDRQFAVLHAQQDKGDRTAFKHPRLAVLQLLLSNAGCMAMQLCAGLSY